MSNLKEYHKFSETQWDVANVNQVVAIAGEVNLFSLINNTTDKNHNNSDDFDELNIISNGIKTVYWNQKTIHTIRLTFDITAGNTQFFRIELRRASNDSVISIHQAQRNMDESRQTINILTRTLSNTDPFVVPGGGFYVAFVNDSGLEATISGPLQLVIISQYQFGL